MSEMIRALGVELENPVGQGVIVQILVAHSEYRQHGLGDDLECLAQDCTLNVHYPPNASAYLGRGKSCSGGS
jgi:hypothetical protein